MDWIYSICCRKKRNNSDDEIELPVEVISPIKSFSSYVDKSMSSVYNTSMYKKVSEWSLPKKQVHVNLFGLNANDISSYRQFNPIKEEEYSEESFEGVVDQVID